MAYIGNSPGVASQRIVSKFTATASQTTFTPTSGYTVGYLDVYMNGVKLINGEDYTASNGSTFVLASGAASGDVVESVAYLPRGLSDGYTKAEADARYMDINSVPTPAAVSDAANTSTGYFALPAGTTAQRPGSAAVGYTRMNTTTGSVEFYDGTNWVSTNLIPVINSISGTIYVGVSSTLTLSLANATDTIDVKYYEGGTLLATDSGVTVTSGSATSTVPSAVYGQTVGDTISISVVNVDGTPSSNSISKTVQALPTGGTITTSGGYRYHTFTSSSSFVVPSGFSATADYLIVAGGGASAGGSSEPTGGGGGGGLISGSAAVTSQTYTVTVGAGGAGQAGNLGTSANNGNNSSVFGLTAIGGGGGGSGTATAGASGGSGGGGSGWSSGAGGSGTSGQGYAGGAGSTGSPYGSGGGGGAGQAGQNASNGSFTGAYGGDGQNFSTWATATSTGDNGFYAGGGGGSLFGGGSGGPGGDGGGADGISGAPSTNGLSGQTNTGGGGSGATGSGTGGSGGSGIVIIRYQL